MLAILQTADIRRPDRTAVDCARNFLHFAERDLILSEACLFRSGEYDRRIEEACEHLFDALRFLGVEVVAADPSRSDRRVETVEEAV